ncbi:MAG: COX15/CtaA family protein [Marinosulfonomonas sp.]|nr:COX15/CtaA family protein [Marinosulfonomonas sp.]
MSKKRSIFEDVGDVSPGANAPQAGIIDKAPRGARRLIRSWLAVMFFLVAANVLLGVLNRLAGIGPDQVIWLAAVVWAAGFAGFFLAKRIPTGWTGRLIAVGVLTSLLALTGWWGEIFAATPRLVEVESYRILIQRGLGFASMGLIAWHILLLSRSEAELMTARRGRKPQLWVATALLVVLALVHVLRGGVLAGVYGADLYTGWPLIEGQLIPEGLFSHTPVWANLFENPLFVQFAHRMIGFIMFAFGAFVWWRSRSSGNLATKRAFHLMMAMLLVQLGLGAMVVTTANQWHGALAFQLGAIILWVLILRARFLAGYPLAQSVRGK